MLHFSPFSRLAGDLSNMINENTYLFRRNMFCSQETSSTIAPRRAMVPLPLKGKVFVYCAIA